MASLKKKFEDAMRAYVEGVLLPVCYEVAKTHGYEGDQDSFNAEVLSILKGKKEHA